ncbi:hypothetical protein HA466_0070470 [Hirschfeldia incana]|nr:hypothetical protein HA466_0070470 [Hirschfeldia incana]
MAMDDDSDKSNTVKCICSDKKVVEVDRKTWELFNKMVPKRGFHRLREPVEMYFVRSTVFKKILTYCVRISDGACSERSMYDELLHSESLIGLFHLVETADFLNFESLDAFILQYVEDKSEEEISYMVRHEKLKSLLKIIKFARFYLKNPEKLFSAVLPLVKKSQEEFSQMIVNKDLRSLIKLIKVAEYIGYENAREAARNHILCKPSSQLFHEIHSQNLKSLIKIFKVAKAEKLQPLQDMVVQYVDSKSKKELVQMVSTELSCRRFDFLNESEYLRRGTIGSDELFRAIYTFIPEEEEEDTLMNHHLI